MKVNILCLADDVIHAELREALENDSIDFVLTLGDLHSRDVEIVNELRPDLEVLGVYGNHCSGTYLEENEVHNLHLQYLEIGGIVLTGFEGCVKYKEDSTSKMYTQQQCRELVSEHLSEYADILVLHCPPYGINNNKDKSHIGYEGLLDYVNEYVPKHIFHGHTYRDDEFIEEYNETEVHYVYGVEIVTIDV